jgi:parallel beta-helix repeat protein
MFQWYGAAEEFALGLMEQLIPPYAPIQRSGNVYTFTSNINDSITILRNNAVVDGAGYTVDIKTEGGIRLDGSNITFKNTRITSSAYYTPTISAGFGNTVSDNTITYAAYGISLGSSGSTVSDNTITAGEKGIHLNGADHNDVFGNVIRNSGDGIFLRGSSDYNMFSGNEIANNRLSGICLSGSSNNTISDNVITNSNYGIELYYTSNNNTIFGNAIRNNERGVDMSFYQGSPTNNAIYLNNITNNEYGIYLESSNHNKFYHNNFVGNTKQVYLYDSIDYWDDDYPSGGNYWSDYTRVDLKSGPNQDLSGSDGIGDTPYVIEGYIKDRYPLMNMKDIPEFPSFLILPLFMIATLLAVMVYRKRGINNRKTRSD